MLTVLTACSPRQLVVRSMADELAGQGMGAESDLDLAREASAFYLKLSESVLQQAPDHRLLAESVAAGFTQYAYAFVAFDADRIEARDVKQAERLRQRAARLYLRAQRHAMNALETARPGFAAALARPQASEWPVLRKDQVGLAYWAAAAWGGAISLSKDDPDAVADLPLAIRLAELAWAMDPEWGEGALTSLMATFEAARPGGSSQRAQALFERSFAQSKGRSIGPLVGQAEAIALPAGDRAVFETLLNQALAFKDAPAGPQALQNEVMRRRARWLLDAADDLF
ncbi:TRAP transporter TatT component family protein [Uliginosibacterium sp. TH139]|uniref:TRAP transporter TatT component family protein n=1 Tax=Uliginosibacterium sp. TH139 TaxID=2067453 RepID=UPI000C7C5EFB|nr:TRAP transporter TatT component family protein [Uliginosibacterium sp. TH139]PLK48330.1 hypothetical protein C0V76_13345 [Uliginosibacterium sp. TH139]